MLQPEEIADLADHLRGEGYQFTLHQVLAAQTVVRQESLRDSELGSLVRLVTVLRPIFSSTPDEQERFEKLYLEWLRTRSSRPRTISSSPPPTPPPEPPRIHWRMKLAVPCLLIVPALTTWFLWQDLRAREAVGRIVADNQPVPHATVKLGDRTVTTDEQGAFKVPFKNHDMPLPLLVEMKGYLPNQSRAGETVQTNRKWFYLDPVDLATQFEIGEVQLAKETVSATSPATHELSPQELSFEKIPTLRPQRLSYPTALMALAPSLLVLLWLTYRFSRRAVLKRQSSRIPPELKQIHVKAGTQRLFPSLSLRYVTQRLRQTRFEESAELDVPRTIHLTMNRGGLFTPVFGSRREPSYVALIDRATVADHQANVAAQVVKDLARGYVLVRQYEFDEQPTILRKVDPLHAKPKQSEGTTAVATRLEIMSLGEVTAKFPTSRLLCFADPMTCFDPLTGKLRPWVETLEAWEERFLFTAGTRGQWGQAERILSRRGFHVTPLTHHGLRLFSHLLEQESPQAEPTKETTRERRGTYERTPQRWLERHPPAQDTIAKLLADLRQELGSEGILWLSACAAYPEIHWALTLEWGVRLFGHGPTAETLLPKLTPLVWFRHAFMPDWFRSALYDQVTAHEAERISQELGEIISALNPESGDTLQLKIAMPSGAKQQATPPVGRFSAWLQKFRRKSAIQAMGQAAERGSPMRDYVMLQYLSGKQGKAITPYAPKALLRLLFPKGQPWLGFRPLLLLIAAVLVSTGSWWLLNPVSTPPTSLIVTAGEIFEGLKRVELQVAKLEDLVGQNAKAKELQEIIAKQREIKNLQNKYDRFVKELGLYAGMSEQDKAVFRIVRLFGECEATMPKDFLAEVKKYIQKWKTTDRLHNGMRRAIEAGYIGMISNAMFANNLPPQFIYVALQESGFDPKAIGPKTSMGYSKGMWLFAPGRAKEFGLKLGPLQHEPRFDPEDDRFNAKMATEAAAKYIKRIYLTDAQASGLLVLASYNWGEGNVIKMIRQLPANPQERNFWQLVKKFKVPEETYDYVFYIIAAAVIGEDPQLFGFSFPAPFPKAETAVEP